VTSSPAISLRSGGERWRRTAACAHRHRPEVVDRNDGGPHSCLFPCAVKREKTPPYELWRNIRSQGFSSPSARSRAGNREASGAMLTAQCSAHLAGFAMDRVTSFVPVEIGTHDLGKERGDGVCPMVQFKFDKRYAQGRCSVLFSAEYHLQTSSGHWQGYFSLPRPSRDERL
jgi:hypothetical protein